ncbi:dicarboxylate/amino acid:cation symporter [Terrihalobacillus insolitus]|uniref:dicarboxylate/amino acid:cation symporter n=1 Tax=Terrihalobacillus insolitus TaxID=2950438 RepID=UPI002342183C|nr:dicarboxylate/amino acid:cation symporter [Terrihalobacillus insolitus]MDC3414775.1 dicarboxylate/amino acid:cation symporter [Terrihalobacillus insolitus]
MNWWRKQHLLVQVAIGGAIGIVLGLIFGENISHISPIGDIFIRLLEMLIVPLTFFVLIDGITNLPSIKSLRSIGGMTILYYATTTAIAAFLGICVALLINPGKGAEGILTGGKDIEPEEFSFVENLVNWVPSNIIQSMAETSMLQIIIAATIIGIALLSLGESTKRITKLVHEGSILMLKITDYIMKLAPLGILALIANLVGTTDLSILYESIYYVLSALLGLSILFFVVYPLLIKLLTNYSPIQFLKNVASALTVAAATSSSNATLPASMAVSKKQGISDKVYGFTLPLGATINMDGLAVTFGVTGVFAANLYGLPITIGLILQFIFLGIALSMGTAGARGADIVMMSILMSTLGLPLEIVAIYAAVSPIIDTGNTVNNIFGDLTGTAIINKRYSGEDNLPTHDEKNISTLS